MAITAFSNLHITISDGGTVPSIDYLAKKVFVNIGTGNILKITWDTPIAAGNIVDSYVVSILMYDSSSDSYKDLYKANVGNVNEFYLKAALLEGIQQSFIPIYVCVEAVSKYGSAYNGISAMLPAYISKGCGTYVKAEAGYAQPVMKRTLAFAKLDYLTLVDEAGNTVTDLNGNPVFGKVSSTQADVGGWTLMQEFYASNGQRSDMQYEVLLDEFGSIITDINDDPVYIL